MEASEEQLRELDALSEALVFADPNDSEALADINSRVKNIAAWVAGHGLDASETALGHASKSASDKDGEGVEAALGFISEMVSALQIVIRDGRPESEVTFPQLRQNPDSEDSSGAHESLPLTLPAYIDDAIFNEFLARQPGVLDEMESFILDIETDGTSQGLGALRRMLHTLKGESALLGLEAIEELCHTWEDALDAGDPTQHADTFLDVKDWMASAFQAYALGVHPTERPDALLQYLEVLKSSEPSGSDTEASGSDTEPLVVPLEEQLGPILDVIEKLDPADMQALASLHTSLEALSQSMETEGSGAKAEVDSALEAVTKIIFGEVKDAAKSLLDVQRILEGVTHPQAEVTHAQAGAVQTQAGVAETAGDTPYVSERAVDFSTVQDGDLEALEEFASETETSLESIEVQLLALESTAGDSEAINTLVRGFRTINDVAGFLELPDIRDLSGAALGLAEKARDEVAEFSPATIDAEFDVVKCLKFLIGEMTMAVEERGILNRSDRVSPILEKIRDLPVVAASQPETLAGEDIEESEVTEGKRLGDILVEASAATMEDVKEALRKQYEPPEVAQLGALLVDAVATSNREIQEALAIQKSDPSRRLGDILVSLGALSTEDLERALARQSETPQLPKLGEVLVREQAATARDVSQALRAQEQSVRSGSPIRQSVKVDGERLDRLVDIIGELVIAQSMVSLSPELRKSISPALDKNLGQIDKITRELQEIGTTLRMVSVRATFKKMARLVRDLAKKSGREVNFIMSGEDTELDKSLVDQIADPLVHMIRNAVDHGLERNGDDRIAAGKSPAGRIELRAFHRGGSVYIELEDDGRGLNREVIVEKALERGVIDSDENLEDRDVWNLIFESGFSTAGEVTDVSGRGVGMDVVRRNISELRGQINIESALGQGTTFSMRLPLTLAVIDGMVVRSGTERFVLPTLSVLRLLRPDEIELISVLCNHRMIKLDDALIPLYEMSWLLGVNSESAGSVDGVVVVLEGVDGMVAIQADEVLGQQQTVIKPLGEGIETTPGIAGGAILPDGRVGLILDVSGLEELARSLPGPRVAGKGTGAEIPANGNGNGNGGGGEITLPVLDDATQQSNVSPAKNVLG
jgi:two-component system chemotaxis sensor kinase CheA